MSRILYLLYYGLMISPIFVSNIFTTNVSGLIQTCPPLYYAWALSMTAMMVIPGWKHKKDRPILAIAALLFILSILVPWKPWFPGWLKDIHVWGQITGIILCSLLRLPGLLWGQQRAYFFLLAISFTLMCLAGQVNGLCEIVFAVGLGMIGQFHLS